MKKVLNLYSGIGGNRLLWKDVAVVAVEYNKDIASIYSDFFPNDEVVVTDAHQFLLDNYSDFDFIWSSPPCPSHSRVRKANIKQNKPIYPDMKLYEEILFLQGYANCKYAIENVISWYEPLIKPQNISLHYFWANYHIPDIIDVVTRNHDSGIDTLQKFKGFDLSKYHNLKIEKKILLRNCVEPQIGKHVFDSAFTMKQNILLI